MANRIAQAEAPSKRFFAVVAQGVALAMLVGFPGFAGYCLAQAKPGEPANAPASAPVLDGVLLAPKAFRAAVERVRPCVVVIETYGGVAGVGAEAPGKDSVLKPSAKPAPNPSPIPAIPGLPTPRPGPGPGPGGARPPRPGMGTPGAGISKPGEGPTTGLVVSADGHILTSTYNFLRQPSVITVALSDGSRHVAKLLGRDESRKICLLKIDASGLPTPALPSGQAVVGQWALSLGMGYGGDGPPPWPPAVSVGVVSALGRAGGKVVQTDANVSPANYGGPLIDIDGAVLGVCVPINPREQGALAGVEWYDSGIGFAIPLRGLDRIVEAMKKGETIRPGILGVLIEPVPDQAGPRVTSLGPKSPAGLAGVKVGDIIAALDGQPVADAAALRRALINRAAGDTVKLTIKREGQTLEIAVTLMAAP